ETVAFTPDLTTPAYAHEGRLETSAVVVDAAECAGALVLVSGSDGCRLGQLPLSEPAVTGVDLTRPAAGLDPAAAVVPLPGQARALSDEDMARWTALGLALTSADLVGAMRGAIRLACDYAGTRHQFGAAIGS